jgi:hypothetical protein
VDEETGAVDGWDGGGVERKRGGREMCFEDTNVVEMDGCIKRIDRVGRESCLLRFLITPLLH